MKKRSSVLAVVIFIIFLGLVLFAGPFYDQLFAPWAFQHSGRPPLTGTWVGQLTTATGQTYGVILNLILPEPGGRGGLVRDWEYAPYGELAGTASVCDQRGQTMMYIIEGQPEDRQATYITFYASPSETPAPNGLTISWVKGSWDGADNLSLSVQLYWKQDDSAITGPEYPDTQSDAMLPMTRGGDDEFNVICN